MNISAYSTPPASPHNSHAVPDMVPLQLMKIPSFSLGLTQEAVVTLSPISNINVADNIVDPQSSRKSKRHKTVPSALLEDYHCGPHILSRMRRADKVVFVRYDKFEMERKFVRLSEKLKGNVVINVAGLSVSSRELLLMAERPRLLSSKVVDILIRLVRYVVSGQPCTEGVNRYEFLDTKFGASIVRNYPKFSMSKKKDSCPFPKGLMDYFGNKGVSSTYPIRYYIPFLIEKKHWIGVCFDTSKGHLHVFDSNMSFTKEATMARNLTPLLQMLPYLARRICQDMCGDGLAYRFDRPKGVSQITNPSDSGLMAVLLMVTHAVHGNEACSNITSSCLADEGKSAAILAYELKEEL
ncbi:hypothetical protein F2Q69_00055501 [Brassica cretica]|uniref:Ubiquitin-like protease family profile domain-containing protein n=1 Tax=Brassica cretica TaxID=69181 RepID=A0A8S9N4U6_BRACR|nr:hypothetical protein F2Q69_00055501 [Brassica cretica]